VAVIVANHMSALAAKAATTTVPIIFATGSDPVADGLVTSLNRPGGNITGVSFLGSTVGAKRLELLHQFVPKATTIAMLVSPGIRETEAERSDVQAAAQAVGYCLCSGPGVFDDIKINHRRGGRGFYFRVGHVLEVLTA
jgi:ABC-type uncharacterized transport system substrate-binding protein